MDNAGKIRRLKKELSQLTSRRPRAGSDYAERAYEVNSLNAEIRRLENLVKKNPARAFKFPVKTIKYKPRADYRIDYVEDKRIGSVLLNTAKLRNGRVQIDRQRYTKNFTLKSAHELTVTLNRKAKGILKGFFRVANGDTLDGAPI